MNIRNNYIKVAIVVIVLIFWSTILVLLIQIKNTISQQTKTPIIELADTIINKQPKFFIQQPSEGIEEALSYYGLKHKDIVLAQAILETGHFTSRICLEYNNLFGLYDSKNKDYYKFNHWSESVVAYKEWIQKRYQPPNDYYIFLKKINYAEKEDYTRLLKKIVKSRKNDKRGHIERDSFA